MPQYSIPPGGVEGERADLVVPLDAVDGELPVGGGGGDVGGKIDDQAQGADDQDSPGDGQVALAQEEDFPRSGGVAAKQLHSDPVLSLQKNLCAEGKIMRQGREKGRAVQKKPEDFSLATRGKRCKIEGNTVRLESRKKKWIYLTLFCQSPSVR